VGRSSSDPTQFSQSNFGRLTDKNCCDDDDLTSISSKKIVKTLRWNSKVKLQFYPHHLEFGLSKGDLWWSEDELESIQKQTRQELKDVMSKFSISWQDAKRLLHQNDIQNSAKF
jgi:hypothetical protein